MSEGQSPLSCSVIEMTSLQQNINSNMISYDSLYTSPYWNFELYDESYEKFVL